jgi:hypothetical protein
VTVHSGAAGVEQGRPGRSGVDRAVHRSPYRSPYEASSNAAAWPALAATMSKAIFTACAARSSRRRSGPPAQVRTDGKHVSAFGWDSLRPRWSNRRQPRRAPGGTRKGEAVMKRTGCLLLGSPGTAARGASWLALVSDQHDLVLPFDIEQFSRLDQVAQLPVTIVA